MIQTVPVRETRERLAELIASVQVGGHQIVITKFGKPAAMLVPVVGTKKSKRRKFGIEAGFGAWRERKDIKDSAKWVANLRAKMSRRYA